LLPVGPDSRAPMRQIYQMFKGEMRPEQMLASAGTAADRYTAGGYIHDVAVVHRDILLRSK
jgi:hypothetical protein